MFDVTAIAGKQNLSFSYSQPKNKKLKSGLFLESISRLSGALMGTCKQDAYTVVFLQKGLRRQDRWMNITK